MTDDTTTLALLGRIEAGEGTLDDCAAALAAVEALERRAKQLKASLEDALIAHIRATGQDLVIGEIRYYAGHRKSVKCLDVPATFDAAVEAAGGDLGRVLNECLASDALKPGAVKALIGDEAFGRLYRVEVREELGEGKPRKRLLKVNDRYANNT
jgi:hypothetical protein